MSKKKRVAVLVRRFVQTGGAERYAVEVSRRLREKFALTIFCEETDEALAQEFNIYQLPSAPVKSRFIAYQRFSNITEKLTKDFSIVHSHERVTHGDVVTLHCPCFRSYQLREKTSWKYWREMLNAGMLPRYWWHNRMERGQFLNQPKRLFLAASQYVVNNVRRLYDVDESRFAVAYPGVDAEKFCRRLSSRQAMREAWGVAEKEKVMLFVGNEFQRKGLDTTLRAFAMLEQKSPVRLVIVGNGARKRYLALARELGIENQVHFIGLCSNMQDIYSAADAFVLPTRVDPASMAPLEAMAAELPTITSGAVYNGFAERIEAGEALLLKDPESAHELRSAMMLALDPSESEKLSLRGRHRAEACSWEVTSEVTAQLYNTILKNKGK